MGPNPTQYQQMVAGDISQEEIPPLEEEVQEEEDPEEDNDSEDKDERGLFLDRSKI
jgi:hypothetical protein